jgi:hypothetical protein
VLDLSNYNKIVKIDETSASYRRAASRASGLNPSLTQVELQSLKEGYAEYLTASASQPVNYSTAIWISKSGGQYYGMCDCETYGQHFDGTRSIVCKHIFSALADYKARMCEVCLVEPIVKLALDAKSAGVKVEQLCTNCLKVEHYMTSRNSRDK